MAWGNVFDLGDTLQNVAVIKSLQQRSRYLDEEQERSREKARTEALDREQKAQMQRLAVQKMMARDIYSRAMSEGLQGDALIQRVGELLPAYQNVYKTVGGDWSDATPDSILALGMDTDAEDEARKARLQEGARYDVRHQYGDTPIDKYVLDEKAAQRGSLPQGYRWGSGGAERIPGLDTPEQELDRKLREKAAPTYQDLNPQAKVLDPAKQFDQRKQYSDLMSTIDTAIADAEEAYTLQSKTDRTGPILGGGGLVTQINKALPGGEDIQRLEKAYNRQAASALAAFKALGMAGQLSDKEGEWVRSTEAQLSNDKEVNLETLSRGIALLKDRKKRISQLGSEYGLGEGDGMQPSTGGRKPLPPGFVELPDGRVRGPDGRTYRYAR